MSDQLDVRRRRASFRATHRGTKEMDWLLGRYAEAMLKTMAAADLDVFEKLIQVPDPELQTWILDPTTLEQIEFAPHVNAMRTFHKLA